MVLVMSFTAVTLLACGNPGEGNTDSAPEGATAARGADNETTAKVEGDPTSRGASEGAGAALLGDREQARVGAAAVGGVYDDLNAAVEAGLASVDVPLRDALEKATGDDNLARMCALMSAEAKRQTIVYGKHSAGLADVAWTCEMATAVLLRRARRTGGLKRSLNASVVGVNADDDRATATIRFGGPKGQLSTIPLIKEEGKWKLAATPAGGAR